MNKVIMSNNSDDWQHRYMVSAGYTPTDNPRVWYSNNIHFNKGTIMNKHEEAIERLQISAEACEHNAPIYLANGESEQADACAKNAASYRTAIAMLELS